MELTSTNLEQTLPAGSDTAALGNRDFSQLFADIFDSMLYNSVALLSKNKGQEVSHIADSLRSVWDRLLNRSSVDERIKVDSTYTDNAIFWQEALVNNHFIAKRVLLKDFTLTEWLPTAPGRYFTAGAQRNRERVARNLRQYLESRNEYNPDGKEALVLGGVGSVRLLPKDISGVTVYFLGASSTGISHQGIPIGVLESDYRKVMDGIKQEGGCIVDITATVQAFPPASALVHYDREIPKYYLLANNVTSPRNPVSPLMATVTAMFATDRYASGVGNSETYQTDGFATELNKKWSFCSFNPGGKKRNESMAAEWLIDYARRHDYSPTVLSDFDEHYDHYAGLVPVEFPIKEILRGKIDLDLLNAYQRHYRGITIFTEAIVQGDVFKDIGAGATIVNRSTVQNAFNRVQQAHGDDIAQALKKVEEAVNKAGNKEAADNFNAFNEELSKTEPKKPVLAALWAGVVTALPSLVQMADVVSKITTLFTG